MRARLLPPTLLSPAKAIRASSACRDSSLSSAYAQSALSPLRDPNLAPPSSPPSLPKHSNNYEYTSVKSLSEPKHGFWGGLARKAKAIIEDDNAAQQFETPGRTRLQMSDTATRGQCDNLSHSPESQRKPDNPALQKGLDAITSSLGYIGGTIGNALEVAMAMAAKAKLLLRELKTVKADLAFAKERCAQLEEENRIIRESLEKGDNPEDDDLIRLQLETLLAEKARLAQENSVFARENRFLREIVEYHQLTMQDVVYLDEGSEEVTEVYPIKVPPVSNMDSMGTIQNSTPSSPTAVLRARSPQVAQDCFSSPYAHARACKYLPRC
ncbi:hypothetical protein HYC85_031547 [Camellia sinensis]|uniref:Uncharacterized protein n=1 Tax=Camellia sinensis TaxID=4442 RepID=A0A7J7FUR2_CAMSI|nr:hypothetical protein HYC85_031547 [Camellia sinensis]